MKVRLAVLAAVFATLAVPAAALPLTPKIELNGGSGSVTVPEVPGLDMKIDIVGSNVPFDAPGAYRQVDTVVSFDYVGDAPFRLDFTWRFDSGDWESLDPLRYFAGPIDDRLTTLCDCIGSQSGSSASTSIPEPRSVS